MRCANFQFSILQHYFEVLARPPFHPPSLTDAAARRVARCPWTAPSSATRARGRSSTSRSTTRAEKVRFEAESEIFCSLNGRCFSPRRVILMARCSHSFFDKSSKRDAATSSPSSSRKGAAEYLHSRRGFKGDSYPLCQWVPFV